jgi:sugar phosphate isomerase/epimerase
VSRRVGVCAWIYGDATLEETCARIAAAGYDGVEIPGEPERWPAATLRRQLAAAGLTPVGLTASCGFPATRRDLAHPDPGIRRDAVRYVEDCLRWAAEIGAPLVQMLPSGESRLAPLATREQEWAWSVAAMQEACREAARCSVRISIEPLNRYEAYLVTSTADALAYLGAVGSPWVGMTVDCFHANLEEPDIAASMCAAGPHLWHLHVADTNRRGLGEGHLDLASIGGALDAIGYRGAVVLEVMPPGPDPFQSIKGPDSPAILDGYLRESLPRLRAHLGMPHA